VNAALGSLPSDSDSIEVLHALAEHLSGCRDQGSPQTLADLAQAYQLVSNFDWDDELDERDDLLGRVAFLAWNQARLLIDYPETCSWQARCRQHALAQEQVRNFVAIPFSKTSPSVRDRFLSDEAVLLACCDQLEQERNRAPLKAAQNGRVLYDWIDRSASSNNLTKRQVHFLAAWVAFSIVVAEHFLGDADLQEEWTNRTQYHINEAGGAPALEAKLEAMRISRLYNDYRASQELVAACEALVGRFQDLRMVEGATRARQLGALILRELGDQAGALRWLAAAYSSSQECGDSYVASLSLATTAEILGSKGRFAEALHYGVESLKFAELSGSRWVMGEAQGSIAEVLRDNGRLPAAIEGYRACIGAYEDSGMVAKAAYIRVLLAETLVMAAQPGEATVELLCALPIIEQHKLTHEAVAAIGILREAIRCQQSDPDALRQLGEQLRLMREQGTL
jgi:tetratricopeptide (TPR) repeat protein